MGRHGRTAEGAVLLAGRYRLIEPIGRGGMAEVWCADDMSLGRRIAIKLLDPASPAEGTRDDADRTLGDRVWREARGAARLVHPNVVQVYDVAADGDRVFLVMELVTGRDLAAIIDERGPLAPAQTARLGAQAARALAAAHTAGVVHGDVKPANLLLSDDGVLKLTDFGIARPLHVPVTEEAAGKVVGTAGYLAPEVALGHPPGKASDLYALGCVLYELSTGQPPFTADTSVAVLHRHLHDAPVPPGRLRPEIPPDLEQVILRLLAKHPDGRTGDAARVAEVLELIGQTGTPSTVPDGPAGATEVLPTLAPNVARHARPHTEVLPPPRPSPMEWLARRPLLVATLGAVAVIMVAVIIAATGPEDRPAAGPSQAGTPSAQEPDGARSPDPATRPQSTSSALIALQQRIAQQADSGRLDKDTADKVTEHLEKLAEHLREGKDDELAEKVTEIRDKLDEASRRGDWTPDPTTLRLLDTLATAE
ncbi:serine/threonine protein kinase [Actinomadura sp. KC216]|uniref:serine/threonine-protein kinase n=1 Tax=Actinomadura sp. KC216 TaxID=2530370 RepID=UPI00104F82C4|nr:serine/threonine-protein kinase [Actinomadura sp. KC216]TDB91893.1 serine/threonine protein kinase [Actinomadura sp. KC216]